MSWADFDALARGAGGPRVIRILRRAERSRRLLLLRALVDEMMQSPNLTGPLPSANNAWELLARVQQHTPLTLERMLAHPYTGSWAGYSTQLLRNQIDGVCPLWTHLGHVHALAAAAGIRAHIAFETRIPVWQGGAALPTLGMARFPGEDPCSSAEVYSDGHVAEIRAGNRVVAVPNDHSADAASWWGIRQLRANAHRQRIVVRLDDLDPYRGLYEPVPPQRLTDHEVAAWQSLLTDAWELVVQLLPDIAEAMTAGLDSLVPQPVVPFENPSASTGEAFGSAVIAMPTDAAALAATLVHEFHHIRLDGLLHLTRFYEDDPRERFYTPWRDGPRPISGVLQNIYGFFGAATFWRAFANSIKGMDATHAAFEFAYWRSAAWCILRVLRHDPALTETGHRFVDGIAERLGPWQDEPVPSIVADLVASIAADEYAGWRIRYLRAAPDVARKLAEGWINDRTWPLAVTLASDPTPTPVPDGSWTTKRARLMKLAVVQPALFDTVAGANTADSAYAAGQLIEAMDEYRIALAGDPDQAEAWVGLGLCLSAMGTNPKGARALLRYPEVVRAVHRQVRQLTGNSPAPEALATWIGRYAY